jgi:hypothetical protein
VIPPPMQRPGSGSPPPGEILFSLPAPTLWYDPRRGRRLQ